MVIVHPVVGIDLSLTSTGISRLGIDKEMTQVMKTKPTDGNNYVRYDHICSKILDIVHPTDFVFIEGYAFRQNTKYTNSLVTLAELGGVVRHALLKHCHRVPFEVAPNTLKLFVSGYGRSQKDMMMLQAYKKWGKEFRNSDACDAYGLARLGLLVIHGADKADFEYERRCVKTVLQANPDGLNWMKEV